ncbi:MAG: ABC transporter permease [Nocardioidaceae bacterium]
MSTNDLLGDSARRLSPQATPTGSTLGMLAEHIRADIRQNLRVPEYMIGVVAIPVLLFAMFGLPESGQIMPDGTDVGAMMFASLSSYGVVSLAIFTFGVDIAQERGKGWVRRLRATPMPMWVYFAGKSAMALVFSAVILVVMYVVAVLGGTEFDLARLARTAAVLLAGALAFAPLGFALAYWTRPRAASAIANLVFLPLSFASGFFFTLNGLPAILQDTAPYLPTYHFGQLVWSSMATPADVQDFGSPAPDSLLVHLTWVVACFVVFGALAVWGYRRDLQRTINR